MQTRHKWIMRAALYSTAVLALIALASDVLAQQPAAAQRWVGLSLPDALTRLQSEGITIVFTSQTVRADMLVETEPVSNEPGEILQQILSPHGLAANKGSSGVFVVIQAPRFRIEGVIRARDSGTEIPGAEVSLRERQRSTHTGSNGGFAFEDLSPGECALVVRSFGFVTLETTVVIATADSNLGTLELVLSPAVHEEIVVQPSQLRLLETNPTAPLSMTREQIDRLPHLGGDFLRAVSLLPGTSANDFTAQFNIHGGRRDEVQIVLDGQELYEAFHLKDYDNALSIIADENLSLAQLSTGAFPASHGDRMSGVLDLTTVTPSLPLATRLSASVTSLSVLNSGRFANRRGGWFLSGRTSSTFIPSDVIGTAKPSFWDAFAKIEYDLDPRNTLTARVLAAGDQLSEEERADDVIKDFATEYNSLYAWIIHQAIVGGQALVRSTLSWSSIDRDRRGFEIDDEFTFEVSDLRDLEVASLTQAWDVQLGTDHVLRFGADVRQFDAGYDYLSTIESGDEAPSTNEYVDELDGVHAGVWLSDRFSPLEPLTLEVGLRFDRHTLTDDSLTSPRVNAAWRLTEGSVLRASWGVFHQTQRPYELQVEDGEHRFFQAERSEHWVLGFERLFEQSPVRALRIEAYRRRVVDPRQRFENLIEPVNTFPEIEPDRVLVESDKGRADGIELLVRGTAGTQIDWGFMYAWARSEDLIGDAWRPRLTDQRHTITADCNYQLGKRWNLNAAWRYHSGWPTTDFSVEENEDGDYELVFGPYNSLRLRTYHRLDMRASRNWQTRRGLVTFYVDVQNLYNRENTAGFDAVLDDETGELEVTTEYWPGILPSLGISWQF